MDQKKRKISMNRGVVLVNSLYTVESSPFTKKNLFSRNDQQLSLLFSEMCKNKEGESFSDFSKINVQTLTTPRVCIVNNTKQFNSGEGSSTFSSDSFSEKVNDTQLLYNVIPSKKIKTRLNEKERREEIQKNELIESIKNLQYPKNYPLYSFVRSKNDYPLSQKLNNLHKSSGSGVSTFRIKEKVIITFKEFTTDYFKLSPNTEPYFFEVFQWDLKEKRRYSQSFYFDFITKKNQEKFLLPREKEKYQLTKNSCIFELNRNKTLALLILMKKLTNVGKSDEKAFYKFTNPPKKKDKEVDPNPNKYPYSADLKEQIKVKEVLSYSLVNFEKIVNLQTKSKREIEITTHMNWKDRKVDNFGIEGIPKKTKQKKSFSGKFRVQIKRSSKNENESLSLSDNYQSFCDHDEIEDEEDENYIPKMRTFPDIKDSLLPNTKFQNISFLYPHSTNFLKNVAIKVTIKKIDPETLKITDLKNSVIKSNSTFFIDTENRTNPKTLSKFTCISRDFYFEDELLVSLSPDFCKTQAKEHYMMLLFEFYKKGKKVLMEYIGYSYLYFLDHDENNDTFSLAHGKYVLKFFVDDEKKRKKRLHKRIFKFNENIIRFTRNMREDNFFIKENEDKENFGTTSEIKKSGQLFHLVVSSKSSLVTIDENLQKFHSNPSKYFTYLLKSLDLNFGYFSRHIGVYFNYIIHNLLCETSIKLESVESDLDIDEPASFPKRVSRNILKRAKTQTTLDKPQSFDNKRKEKRKNYFKLLTVVINNYAKKVTSIKSGKTTTNEDLSYKKCTILEKYVNEVFTNDDFTVLSGSYSLLENNDVSTTIDADEWDLFNDVFIGLKIKSSIPVNFEKEEKTKKDFIIIVKALFGKLRKFRTYPFYCILKEWTEIQRNDKNGQQSLLINSHKWFYIGLIKKSLLLYYDNFGKLFSKISHEINANEEKSKEKKYVEKLKIIGKQMKIEERKIIRVTVKIISNFLVSFIEGIEINGPKNKQEEVDTIISEIVDFFSECIFLIPQIPLKLKIEIMQNCLEAFNSLISQQRGTTVDQCIKRHYMKHLFMKNIIIKNFLLLNLNHSFVPIGTCIIKQFRRGDLFNQNWSLRVFKLMFLVELSYLIEQENNKYKYMQLGEGSQIKIFRKLVLNMIEDLPKFLKSAEVDIEGSRLELQRLINEGEIYERNIKMKSNRSVSVIPIQAQSLVDPSLEKVKNLDAFSFKENEKTREPSPRGDSTPQGSGTTTRMHGLSVKRHMKDLIKSKQKLNSHKKLFDYKMYQVNFFEKELYLELILIMLAKGIECDEIDYYEEELKRSRSFGKLELFLMEPISTPTHNTNLERKSDSNLIIEMKSPMTEKEENDQEEEENRESRNMRKYLMRFIDVCLNVFLKSSQKERNKLIEIYMYNLSKEPPMMFYLHEKLTKSRIINSDIVEIKAWDEISLYNTTLLLLRLIISLEEFLKNKKIVFEWLLVLYDRIDYEFDNFFHFIIKYLILLLKRLNSEDNYLDGELVDIVNKFMSKIVLFLLEESKLYDKKHREREREMVKKKVVDSNKAVFIRKETLDGNGKTKNERGERGSFMTDVDLKVFKYLRLFHEILVLNYHFFGVDFKKKNKNLKISKPKSKSEHNLKLKSKDKNNTKSSNNSKKRFSLDLLLQKVFTILSKLDHKFFSNGDYAISLSLLFDYYNFLNNPGQEEENFFVVNHWPAIKEFLSRIRRVLDIIKNIYTHQNNGCMGKLIDNLNNLIFSSASENYNNGNANGSKSAKKVKNIISRAGALKSEEKIGDITETSLVWLDYLSKFLLSEKLFLESAQCKYYIILYNYFIVKRVCEERNINNHFIEFLRIDLIINDIISNQEVIKIRQLSHLSDLKNVDLKDVNKKIIESVKEVRKIFFVAGFKKMYLNISLNLLAGMLNFRGELLELKKVYEDCTAVSVSMIENKRKNKKFGIGKKKKSQSVRKYGEFYYLVVIEYSHEKRKYIRNEFVVKQREHSRLSDFMKFIRKYYDEKEVVFESFPEIEKYERMFGEDCGEESEMMEDKEREERRTKIYTFVNHCDKYFCEDDDGDDLLDLSEEIDFESTFKRKILTNKFSFQLSYHDPNSGLLEKGEDQLEGKKEKEKLGLEYLCRKKYILTTKEEFPRLSIKSKVVKKDMVMYTPIQNSIMTIEEKIKKIEKFVDVVKIEDVNLLRQTIQGTLIPQVNDGVPLIVSIFCNDKHFKSNDVNIKKWCKELSKKLVILLGMLLHLVENHEGTIEQEIHHTIHREYLKGFACLYKLLYKKIRNRSNREIFDEIGKEYLKVIKVYSSFSYKTFKRKVKKRFGEEIFNQYKEC